MSFDCASAGLADTQATKAAVARAAKRWIGTLVYLHAARPHSPRKSGNAASAGALGRAGSRSYSRAITVITHMFRVCLFAAAKSTACGNSARQIRITFRDDPIKSDEWAAVVDTGRTGGMVAFKSSRLQVDVRLSETGFRKMPNPEASGDRSCLGCAATPSKSERFSFHRNGGPPARQALRSIHKQRVATMNDAQTAASPEPGSGQSATVRTTLPNNEPDAAT